jgi:hypothetical protein
MLLLAMATLTIGDQSDETPTTVSVDRRSESNLDNSIGQSSHSHQTQFDDPSSQPAIQVVLDELRLVRELMRRAEDGRQAMAIELQQIRREQIEFKTALESIQAQQYNMTSTTASLNNIAQQVLRRIDKLNETMVGNMANYANNIKSAFTTAFDGKTTEDSVIGSDFNAVVEELSSLTSQASEVGLFELPQKIDDLRAELFQAVGPDGYFMTSVLGVLYMISSDNEAMFHNLNAHVDNASSELLAVIQETKNMSSLVISHLDDSTAAIQSQLKQSYNLALSATGEHSSILNVINDNVTKEIKSLATALHRDVPQRFLDEFKRSVSVDLSSANGVLMSQMQRQWESQSNLSRHVLDNTCGGFDRTLANVRNDILSRVDAQEVQLRNTTLQSIFVGRSLFLVLFRQSATATTD